MEYKTIKINEKRGVLTAQIYRPDANNSINNLLLDELLDVLKTSEDNDSIKVMVIKGLPDLFCTGMDFQAFTDEINSDAQTSMEANHYYSLLSGLAESSKIVVSYVEGRVNAGGMGIVAASDIVIAGKNAAFSLSEALFGLIPACVLPFLIRRIGYQKAYWLTISAQSITADRAYEIGLVDEYSDNIQDSLRKYLVKLLRIDPQTTQRIKTYMKKLWIINEETQKTAVDQLSDLTAEARVRENIKNYVEKGVFPWQK